MQLFGKTHSRQPGSFCGNLIFALTAYVVNYIISTIVASRADIE